MRTVRVGTIVWGAILLVFAAIAFGVAVFDLRLVQAVSVTWIVTGVGVVFVLAALVALISRATNSPAESPSVPQAAPARTEPDAPATASAEPVAPAKAGTSTKKAATKGQPVD